MRQGYHSQIVPFFAEETKRNLRWHVGVAILLTDLLPMASGLLFSGENIVWFLLFQDFSWLEASEEVEGADDVVKWVSRQVTSK